MRDDTGGNNTGFETDLDPLTGLPRYEAFRAACAETLARACRTGGAASVGLLDIDLFARMNEEHGAGMGDALLRRIAEALRVRLPKGTPVYRFGGDAFSVLLEGLEKEQAFLALEQARAAIAGPQALESEGQRIEWDLGLSGGVAACPDDGTEADEIIRKATEALYRSKVGGRNRLYLAREEKMVTKTSHYPQGLLHGLSRLAAREGLGEAVLLREALQDLLMKYNG